MELGFIKVAAGTPKVTVADCEANGREILEIIREMEKEHTKVMVFPELCITGYTAMIFSGSAHFLILHGLPFCFLQRKQKIRTGLFSLDFPFGKAESFIMRQQF